MMHKYVLSNAHFYCETVDISRPFPSSSPVHEPSWEFVWNRWLSAPLRAVNLPGHCPHLMQVIQFWSPTLGSMGCDSYDFVSLAFSAVLGILWPLVLGVLVTRHSKHWYH